MRMIHLAGSALIAALILCQGASWASPPMSAVVLEPVSLADESGAQLAKLEPGAAYQCLGGEDGRLKIRLANGRTGFIAGDKAAVVQGSPQSHKRRLKRLKGRKLPVEVWSRLASGRIMTGDTMPWVEMAWGRPNRSFMVNYLSDEQHYIYFLSENRKVILRFKSGRLAKPLDCQTKKLCP